jgi:hypothetical protein
MMDASRSSARRARRAVPGLEGLGGLLGLRHVQAQRELAHRGLAGIVRERGLGVEAQHEHRRRALFRRRQHEAAGNDARQEAVAGRALLEETDRPRHRVRAQQRDELASCSVAKASSSRPRATASSMSGASVVAPMACAKASTFCTNSENSISLSGPLRLAICTPAWNSP